MTQPLAQRLWIYQAERFPLIKTVPLLIVFSAASVTISAHLAGRALPGVWAYATAFLLALVLFFLMRVADEIKDFEDDCTYRPERPVPRGLITLRTLVTIGTGAAIGAAVVSISFDTRVFWLLVLVWAWFLAMSFEFGVPKWLKARPWLYLASHMAIMPLIDLLLTGVEWSPAGAPAPALWTFLALSFVNGCVLEIGRKLWAPENEIAGVDTYSSLLGPARAALVWVLCVVAAYSLLLAVGYFAGALFQIAVVGCIGLCTALWAARGYAKAPTAQWQGRLDALSGAWVLVCYAAAGFLPPLFGATL